MSIQLIENYYREVDRIKRYGGSKQESSVEVEFYNLLNAYCKIQNLLLIPKLEYTTKKGTTVRPDGTVKDALRLAWGYLENKDEYDDLNQEIKKKIEDGYPTSNIIFQDSQTVVLIQEGREVNRTSISDAHHLDELFQKFIHFERKEIRDFHKAIEKFKEDLPIVLTTLREMFDEQGRVNKRFQRSRDKLLKICKTAINPNITEFDIREMLIQHILSEEIFITVFNEPQFHRENTIAKELDKVTNTFFVKKVRRDTLGLIDHYYLIIKATASTIENHHEKQKFLKVLYENFYRTYNPKAADRLGIFYTPNEIVHFIIQGAEHLTHKHFGRLLSDRRVEILDPATGTGTFITDIIEWIPSEKLEHKYKNEIHCNEVAILPYYIANLNIEFTYKQKMRSYEPFENICFVDTLDNLGFRFKDKQTTLFDIGDENLDRIQRQNEKKISVIIGNPPYNANQLNWNENNKNREYPAIDKRIKETYVKASNAQKTKMYDMFVRFYRWASDRLDKNGIIAFITNRSFIDKGTFDGFRACIENDFGHVYIIDTQSDVRKNPKIAGTTHNVFGIQTGVAVMFLVRDENKKSPCQISYYSLIDDQIKEEKLEWFASNKLQDVVFEHIIPDKNHNWINLSENDFDELIPLFHKDKKTLSIFNLMAPGVSSGRDDWVFDHSTENLIQKIKFFVQSYNKSLKIVKGIDEKNIKDIINYEIKWSDTLQSSLLKKIKLAFVDEKIIEFNYRPYVKRKYYSEKKLSDRLTTHHYHIFGKTLQNENKVICFSGIGSSKTFSTLGSKIISSYDLIEKTHNLPLYCYDSKNTKICNVSSWALQTFQEVYKDKTITKENIFNYVYGVLNDPAYYRKYENNLKREYPRIPLYPDFWRWELWGNKLLELHLNYERIKPFKLKRINKKIAGKTIKVKLKANKEDGTIILDSETTLTGIPIEAWSYKIRDRSALEWILDQYKEKTEEDPTIKQRFDNYQFKDYKEEVIDLLKKVTKVSVETMKIIKQMKSSDD